MSSTIWENEKKTFDKIAEKARMEEVRANSVMIQKPGRLKNNNIFQMSGNSYELKNENGKNMVFMENDEVAEISYWYDIGDRKRVTIAYDKTTSEIVYYSRGHEGNNMLAHITPRETEIPIYGSEEARYNGELPKLQKTGDLPASEIKSTVRETIEKTIMDNPKLRTEGYEILAAFDEILSLDKEREIKPLSEDEIYNLKLKDSVKHTKEQNGVLFAENHNLKSDIGELKAKNDKLEAEKAELEAKISALEAEKAELKSENSQQKSAIEYLMEKVKGIPFFGKRIVQGMTNMLPKGRNEELRGGTIPNEKENDDGRESFSNSLKVNVSGINGINNRQVDENQQQISDRESGEEK